MAKYSMRHLLCIVLFLFLLYCTCGCFGTAVVQQLPQKGQSGLQTYTVSTQEDTDKKPDEWHPIRIGVYTKYVEFAVKFFETKKQKEEVEIPIDLGEEIQKEFDPEGDRYIRAEIDEYLIALCEPECHEMTEEKKNILFQNVLPKAIKLHTDRLKVKPVEEIASAVDENKEWCRYFRVPLKSILEKTPDVDFMIFVSLSKTYQNVEICTKNNENRPTSAVITFIPNEIKNTRHFIRLAAREIAKGLGFEYNLMKGLGMIKDEYAAKVPAKGSARGKEMHMVEFPKTFEMLKKHYGCEQDGEVKGLYLENEGERPTSFHWERRIAKDELMTPYSDHMGVSGMYYTNLTLGVFHDMKFYRANFNMAEPMSWGNKSECDFLKGVEKGSANAKYPKMFCKEDEKTKETLQCTSDRFALGMCFTKNNHKKLPEGYYYFTGDNKEPVDDLMDGYPIIKPLKGTACEGGNESLMPGSLLGPDSRCLNVNALELKDKRDDVAVHGICAKVKCEGGKVHVQYKGDKEKDKWHECENEDATIDLQGSEFSKGTIVCPNYNEVCTGLPKTEPLTIKFYNGTQGSNVHMVVVNGDDEKNIKRAEEPGKPSATDTHHSDDISVVQPQREVSKQENPEVVGETVSLPLQTGNGEKRMKDKMDDSVSPIGSAPSEEADPKSSLTTIQASDSHTQSSDNNHQQPDVKQLQQHAPVVIDSTPASQNPSTQSIPIPAPAVPSPVPPANPEDKAHGIPNDQTKTLTHITDKGLNDHSKRGEDAPSVPPHPAGSPAEKSLGGEKQMSPEVHGHLSEPKQTQTEVHLPTEAKGPTKDSTPQTENSSTVPTKVQSDAQGEKSTQENHRDVTNAVATPPSTSNLNVTDNTVQSPSTANPSDGHSSGAVNKDSFKGINLNEGQMKEIPNNANVMSVLGPDSSSITSYMTHLALLVCAVGFVMVP